MMFFSLNMFKISGTIILLFVYKLIVNLSLQHFASEIFIFYLEKDNLASLPKDV